MPLAGRAGDQGSSSIGPHAVVRLSIDTKSADPTSRESRSIVKYPKKARSYSKLDMSGTGRRCFCSKEEAMAAGRRRRGTKIIRDFTDANFHRAIAQNSTLENVQAFELWRRVTLLR